MVYRLLCLSVWSWVRTLATLFIVCIHFCGLVVIWRCVFLRAWRPVLDRSGRGVRSTSMPGGITTTYPLTAGVVDDFTTCFLHFSLFSTALWDLANYRPVHSLMLSFHLFLCLPCLLPPFTVPCKMVLTRPDERETCPYHFNLRLFTMFWSSFGPIACWVLARTS